MGAADVEVGKVGRVRLVQIVVGVPWRVAAAGNDGGEEVFGGLLGGLEVDLIENTSEDAQLQKRTGVYQYMNSLQLLGTKD